MMGIDATFLGHCLPRVNSVGIDGASEVIQRPTTQSGPVDGLEEAPVSKVVDHTDDLVD